MSILQKRTNGTRQVYRAVGTVFPTPCDRDSPIFAVTAAAAPHRAERSVCRDNGDCRRKRYPRLAVRLAICHNLVVAGVEAVESLGAVRR